MRADGSRHLPKFDPLKRAASRIIPRPTIEDDDEEEDTAPVIKQEPVDVVFGDDGVESDAGDEPDRDTWRIMRDRPDDNVASDAESISSNEALEEIDDSDDETFDPSHPGLLGKRRMPYLSAGGKRARLLKREQPPQLAETGKLYALPTLSGASSNTAATLTYITRRTRSARRPWPRCSSCSR